MIRALIRSSTAPVALTLGAAASCALLASCQNYTGGPSMFSEGGMGLSEDKHVYVSRSWQPWTVTLRDTRTGQAFWSIDVPVGKKLAIQFLAGHGTENSYTPDLMKWGVINPDDPYTNLVNSLPVPAADVRRLEPTLRATPELPPDMTGRSTTSASVQVR